MSDEKKTGLHSPLRRKLLMGMAALPAISMLPRPSFAQAPATAAINTTGLAVTDTEVTVGILHSVTGTMAISETGSVQAEKLAIEQINAMGGVLGRKIKFIQEDGASDWPTFAEKAKKLLAEAGFKDGLELTIGGYTDQDSVRRGEVIQEQLGKAGIRRKFTRGTIAEISAQFFATETKFDLLVSAWTGRPDPSMTYALGFDQGAYYNAGRTADPELSKLIKESRESEDLAKRAEVFAKIQKITVETALSAPLAFQFELDALSAKVKGFKPNLLGKPKFENISLG